LCTTLHLVGCRLDDLHARRISRESLSTRAERRLLHAAAMRSILLVLLVACTTQAPSGGSTGTGGGKTDDDSSGTLLDCNTSVGPDQQVTVTSDGTTLTLVELTTSGAQVSRTLDPDEWASESLQLRDDFGDATTMSKDSGSWMVRSASSLGYADCWVDKSP
jgi:hypothetical protein